MINPNAILIIGIATGAGALLGATLVGLAIGLGVVAVATLLHL